MASFQEMFDRQTQAVPQLILERILRKKLAAAGVNDDEICAQFATAFLSGSGDVLILDGDPERRIEIDEDDLLQVRKGIAAFIDNLPELTNGFAKETAADIVADLRQQWKETADAEKKPDVYRRKIADRWGPAFDDLHMLLEVCVQEGEKFNFAHLESSDGRNGKIAALARLHIRACRITEEILLLLEGGYVEGAHARWRTLHEITVTAFLISVGGDRLAKRYFDHRIVERKRELDDDRRAAAIIGRKEISSAEAREIRRAFAKVIVKYDTPFQKMYGWASGQLGIPTSPQFHDLQEAAGSLALKPKYRTASFGTHASPQTLRQPIHQWDPTTHVSGLFEAGFEGPAADTAHAIVLITSLLTEGTKSLDRAVALQVMATMLDQVVRLLVKTARDIARDDQKATDQAMRRRGTPLTGMRRKPTARKT